MLEFANKINNNKMNKSDVFFTPFKGEKYEEGICGKKVLVIGASFYCNRTDCKYYNDCTDTKKKDSSQYDKQCSCNDGQPLSAEPSLAVEWDLRTYINFADSIKDFCGTSRDEIWQYVAFTNYVQYMLGANSNYRPTYKSDLTERDYRAFNETLISLQPDIVIIWGCVINSRLKEQNEYIVDKNRLEETDYYVCEIQLPQMNKKVTIINPYHPSMNTYWTPNVEKFKEYLKIELNK